MTIRNLLAAALLAAMPALSAYGAINVNDTARFLAGLPVGGDPAIRALTEDPAWKQHAQYFNAAWTKLEARQLSKARGWAEGNLHGSSSTVFYMFSGPDFLYANAFFPRAQNYVLCGIEPVGNVPDVTKLALGPALYQVENSLNSVLNYSFFQTKQMRMQFSGAQLNGTIPILMVFLARCGKTVENVTPMSRGVRIDFDGGTLYYFSVDLSNGSVERSGLLGLCQGLGRGDSLLKSASYLPHEDGFSEIRNFLLAQSDMIVQDDSGIPYHDFTPGQWQIRLYGSYLPPIDIFKQYFQPDLADAFSRSNPQALPFGIGYRGWDASKSALIVARRR